jgi:carbon monoxide dehydrogenase subunit G
MSELLADRVSVRGARDAIWDIIHDPAALGRVLPGCESLAVGSDGRLHGVLVARLAFMSLRAEVVASLVDAEPPRSLRLVLEGRPRMLAGSFRASIPFTLDAIDDARTLIAYRVDLSTSGRLASFGAPILKDAMRRQISELVTNLEREIAAPTSTGEA